MEARNCRRCGRIFQFRGSYVCPNCMQQDDEDFRVVKQYVIDHPGAPMAEVSAETGVDLKAINRFLREGRLEMEGIEMDSDESGLHCENCQRPIKSGRFCEQCLAQMQQQFTKAANSLEPAKPVHDAEKNADRQRLHTYDAILKRRP